jgi:hypothetical protein
MNKRINRLEEEVNDNEFAEQEEFEQGDFALIFDEVGNLKTFVFSSDEVEVPSNLIELLRSLGISEVDELCPKTLH